MPSNVGAINVRHPIPPKLRFAVLQRDEFTCQYCGAKGPEAGGSAILEIDHRVPVSRGGTNDPVNLVTSCWHCNRGKGATRLHAETFPEQNDDQYQWETCRIEIQLTGTLERQTIILRADRYGAGKKQTVVKPKEFHFRVALPKHQPQELSWAAYWLYLPEKERRILQQEADGIEKRLLKSGWRQVSNQEYRRRMK